MSHPFVDTDDSMKRSIEMAHNRVFKFNRLAAIEKSGATPETKYQDVCDMVTNDEQILIPSPNTVIYFREMCLDHNVEPVYFAKFKTTEKGNYQFKVLTGEKAIKTLFWKMQARGI